MLSIKARGIALALAAVLLLSAAVPVQAVGFGGRGVSSGAWDSFWSWVAGVWGEMAGGGTMEKEGSMIDPNGGPKPQGALVDPNAGEETQGDQSSGIDPKGGPRS